MFHKMNLLIKWFNGNVPFLCYLNIYSIIILIILSSSSVLVQAGVINNLKAEIEAPNLSQPDISSDKQTHLQDDIIFFHILEQIDDGLMIGILLGENVYSPLKIQPIISLGSDQLIGMPLFSNTFDCSVVPLLNEEKERQVQDEEYFLLLNEEKERQVQDEEYFLFINNFYE